MPDDEELLDLGLTKEESELLLQAVHDMLRAEHREAVLPVLRGLQAALEEQVAAYGDEGDA